MTTMRTKTHACYRFECLLSAVCVLSLLAGLATSSIPVVVAQQPDSISVNDGRPLAAAVKIIEDRYGWLVTYEDPPYEHPFEITDVTEQVRRDGDLSKRVLVPKGGMFTFEFGTPPPQATAEQSLQLLTALVSAYHASGNAGRFRVIHTRDVFHVIPAGVRLRNEVVANTSSILDVRVSLPGKPGRSVYEAVNEVIAAINKATGQHVFLARVPTNWLKRTPWEDDAINETARDLLVRMFEATKLGLSWRLLYDPGLHWYGFNVRIVRQPQL